MMMNKECPVCKKIFRTNIANKKFCCVKCLRINNLNKEKRQRDLRRLVKDKRLLENLKIDDEYINQR